jgi:membrane-associated PAP2 superfamily phosphatase
LVLLHAKREQFSHSQLVCSGVIKGRATKAILIVCAILCAVFTVTLFTRGARTSALITVAVVVASIVVATLCVIVAGSTEDDVIQARIELQLFAETGWAGSGIDAS